MHKPATIAKRLLKFFGPNGERWTRGTMAKNKSGQPVSVGSKTAKTFCLTGALEKMNIKSSSFRFFLKDITHSNSVEDFNDHHRWPTIKRTLKEIAAS